MTLVKLTLLTEDQANGVQVWYHTDEIRCLLPLPDGCSGARLLNGETPRFQESSDLVAAIVNGKSKDPFVKKAGRPPKVNEEDINE